MPRTAESYETYKAQQAKISRERSASGRDVGPLPAVVDRARRDACESSLRLFCEQYLSARFPLAWSRDHLKAIARMELCATSGGLFALAMARGSGKTSLAEAAALWSLTYGLRSFVVLIGATEPAAEEMLDSIKLELEVNEDLYDDFPEVCHPVRKLDGIANRANGQTLNGERTRIGWTQKELVLPTVAGSKASGSVLRVAGITGRVRGMRAATADGRTIRPDLVIVDDPSTDDSARSPAQNAAREGVLSGAILGLGGPGRKIAAFLPCTVIAPGDLAERVLDRDRHPEWNGERTRMVYAFPSDQPLWDRYAEMRRDGMRAGDDGAAATEFYRSNRAAMDAGAVVAWEQRFNPDELSAIQHAMNIKIDDPRRFAAEFQNNPLEDKPGGELVQVQADAVAQRLSGLPRGTAPAEATRVTAGIDVQGGVLFYAVVAWDETFGGAIIDYGAYPRQNRAYFAASDARPSLADAHPGMAEAAAIYAGLTALCDDLMARRWPREGGGDPASIELCLIDSGWRTETIHQFCRRSKWSAALTPSKGRGVRAGDKPLADWRAGPGDRVGADWRIDKPMGRSHGRFVFVDVNSWKSFCADRLLSPDGTPGGLLLPGTRAGDHQMLADHLASEYRIRTEGRGRVVEEWRLRPERYDNHLWDCLVLAAVAASVRGLAFSASGAREAPEPPKPKVSFSDMQKKAKEKKRTGAAK